MRTELHKIKWDMDALTKGQAMKVRETYKCLNEIDARKVVDLHQWKRFYIAFHNVGDLPKYSLSPTDRRKVTAVYEQLKGIAKNGHPTIGDAMIALGLKTEADFAVKPIRGQDDLLLDRERDIDLD